MIDATPPRETPSDYLNPDFARSADYRVPFMDMPYEHSWRGCISAEVAAMWHTFTPEQREALALQAAIAFDSFLNVDQPALS